MSEMPLFERLQDQDHGDERVFRVSEVNRAVRFTLEDNWANVLIEGELSDVRRAKGHVYFTLNDEEDPAQLRGVMFQSDVRRTKAPLQDGSRIRFRGTLSLYTARGQFQLIARSAKLAGEGDLAAQFRKLRAKLEAEGLLDPERKRDLPELPRVVGVVTSRTGAALRDIIRVASERCPVQVLVADCRVQGEEAPQSIVSALELIQRVDDLDVVIVSRGGGSAEDLWAFNDEGVARAIAACRVPVVSGVGHEVDVTIADLVADVRAATPSNAAEIVVPEREALLRDVRSLERRLNQALDNRIGGLRLRLERLLRPLYGARRVMAPVRERLAELHQRLMRLDLGLCCGTINVNWPCGRPSSGTRAACQSDANAIGGSLSGLRCRVEGGPWCVKRAQAMPSSARSWMRFVRSGCSSAGTRSLFTKRPAVRFGASRR